MGGAETDREVGKGAETEREVGKGAGSGTGSSFMGCKVSTVKGIRGVISLMFGYGAVERDLHLYIFVQQHI